MLPKRLSFNTALWILGILVSLVITAGPLLLEQYARLTWKSIPCHVTPERFLFVYHDKNYYGGRRSFWQMKNTKSALAAQGFSTLPVNDVCYINSDDPPEAVLHLDAYKNLGDGLGNFAGAAMILAVCAAITYSSKRPKRSTPAA